MNSIAECTFKILEFAPVIKALSNYWKAITYISCKFTFHLSQDKLDPSVPRRVQEENRALIIAAADSLQAKQSQGMQIEGKYTFDEGLEGERTKRKEEKGGSKIKEHLCLDRDFQRIGLQKKGGQ